MNVAESDVVGKRSQRALWGLWVVVTAMLVLALQTVSVPQALGDDGALDTGGAASDYPLTGYDPADEPVPSTVYGGMLWSVVDSRAIEAEGVFQRGTVEVDVLLTNTLATTQLRIPDSMVTLVGTDGSSIPARFVDAGARLAIDPGVEIGVTIAFESPSARPPALGSLTLRIAEANRVPATIGLGDTPTPTDYPVRVAVDTEAFTLTDPDNTSRSIVVTPDAAVIDINAGPYRAAVGEELAVVKVAVQRAEANPDAGYLDTDYWVLEADGQAIPAILAAETPDAGGEGDEVTLLFAFPEGADDLVVTAAGETGFAIVRPS